MLRQAKPIGDAVDQARVEFAIRPAPFGMDLPSPLIQNLRMGQISQNRECPQCGATLTLAPDEQRPRAARCEECARPDPFKSGNANGWLRGELRPPK
jgi:ribosomal protein S27AE